MPIKIMTSADMKFELIPEGVYKTKITKIAEQEQFNRFKNEQEIGFQIEFTILEGEMKDKKAYRFFTPFITPQSRLQALCKAAMGRIFIPEEMASIQGVEDLQRFLGGKVLMITVKTRVSSNGKTYYMVSDYINAGAVAPVPTLVDAPQVVGDPAAPITTNEMSDQELADSLQPPASPEPTAPTPPSGEEEVNPEDMPF